MKKKKNPIPTLKEFYVEHTTTSLDFVHDIKPLRRKKGQPSFINMMSVNGKEVAFLGNKINQPERFKHSFMRIDKIVMPGLARLVNTDVLLKQLPKILPLKRGEFGFIPIEQKQTKEDINSIDVTKKNFFYKGKLERNVILHSPGFVRASKDTNRHFHHCHNFKGKYEPYLALQKSTDGKNKQRSGPVTLEQGHSGLGEEKNCSGGHLIPTHSRGKLKYELPLFYIDKADFAQIFRNELERIIEDEALFAAMGKIFPIGGLQQNLTAYFRDEDLSTTFGPLTLDFEDTTKYGIKGIFLMPMYFPDQSIVYLCLINKGGISNSGNTIKENLKQWFEAIACINEKPEDRELYIGSGDLDFAGLDELACLVGKNAFPVVKDQNHKYEDRRERIAVCKKKRK